ncbi:ankyrin repeat domain-containing protein [Candidatus Babeliales bacterium]|nr:ankyrin repeat domain-containing protein [Candidatus Babeliales bacterium]
MKHKVLICFIGICSIIQNISIVASERRKSSIKSPKSRTEAFIAECSNGKVAKAKALLVSSVNKDGSLVFNKDLDVNGVDKHGDTALIAACKGGHLNVVEFLLSLSKSNQAPLIDINKQGEDGKTALLSTCERLFMVSNDVEARYNPHFNIIKKLLQAGADTTIVDKNNEMMVNVLADGLKEYNGLVNKQLKKEIKKMIGVYDALTELTVKPTPQMIQFLEAYGSFVEGKPQALHDFLFKNKVSFESIMDVLQVTCKTDSIGHLVDWYVDLYPDDRELRRIADRYKQHFTDYITADLQKSTTEEDFSSPDIESYDLAKSTSSSLFEEEQQDSLNASVKLPSIMRRPSNSAVRSKDIQEVNEKANASWIDDVRELEPFTVVSQAPKGLPPLARRQSSFNLNNRLSKNSQSFVDKKRAAVLEQQALSRQESLSDIEFSDAE